MDRLRTLVILVSLGVGGRTASGVASDAPIPPERAEAPTPAVNRPEPLSSPQKYLKAGVLLFNKQRYDLASKYLEAAQLYRDRLTPNEQIVLDEFREQLARYVRDQERAVAPEVLNVPEGQTVDPSVTAVSTVGPRALDMSGERDEPKGDAPLQDVSTPSAVGPAPDGPPRVNTAALRGTADVKQKARWMLHQARERLLYRQFDAAEKLVSETRAMGVKWGYFDDTPDKVAESISTARAKGDHTTAATNLPRDRRTAKARLREARAALNANDLDKADAIAQDVRSWSLRYGLLDDTPEKVAAAVNDGRRRTAVRNAEMMVRSYSGTDAGTRGDPNAPAAPAPATR